MGSELRYQVLQESTFSVKEQHLIISQTGRSDGDGDGDRLRFTALPAARWLMSLPLSRVRVPDRAATRGFTAAISRRRSIAPRAARRNRNDRFDR
ncbi:hypothetical protein SKAU_G00220200 [Synaphobranchus kaupii]|uniref:Uncharacterized protein n=1 Tax=Synaphobranchus kaupii TaxID=118154 RepID=A0A9Q1IVY8_SYNKA|nr:hypothetical protein SKAU_G00220200 [Synaphobranchus kaupii]